MQLSTCCCCCGRKAELAAERKKGRDREVKECGGRRNEDVVATCTGCFQPQPTPSRLASGQASDCLNENDCGIFFTEQLLVVAEEKEKVGEGWRGLNCEEKRK